ncbi:cytochrome P450, partial [Weissella cibaria]|uniref:cytochrome P450 n=1 Tax=Weissella cibaria TaxID=137591 RepID=UPI00143F4489
VPDHDRPRILEFGELAAPSLDIGLSWEQYLSVERGLDGFNAWLARHLGHLKRHPGDDLMSQIIQAGDDGTRLNDEELRATAGLVLAAGFETTVNLLGNGIRILLEHPDQLALLLEDPELWPGAVEEILRLESPVQLSARIARVDTEVAGHRVLAGEPVIL